MTPHRLIVLAFGLVLLAACAGTYEDGQRIPFKHIASGTHSIYTDSMGMEIGDRQRFLAVWKGLNRKAEDLPDIDFNKYSVLAIFLGEQPTGGYRIRVDRIIDATSEWQVYVHVEKPDKDSLVSQARTQPYILVRVPYNWKVINYYYSLQ